MKKGLFLSVLFAGLLFSIELNAQSQGDFRASLGLAAGSKASIDTDTGDDKLGIGINAGVEYFFIDKLSLAPSYSYFFPVDVDGTNFNTSSLNIDARYYMANTFYGLIGYSSFKSKISGNGASFSVSEGAFNLGAGAMIPIANALNINAQVKYQSILDSDIDFNQIVAQLGVAFSF